MPKSAPRPCTYPACKNYAEHGGRCEAHKVKHRWNHKRESRHDRGYGSKWDKLRKSVLARDGHLCQKCLTDGIYTQGNQVDHIKPKSQGGDDSLINLQCLCYHCHQQKTASEH